MQSSSNVLHFDAVLDGTLAPIIDSSMKGDDAMVDLTVSHANDTLFENYQIILSYHVRTENTSFNITNLRFKKTYVMIFTDSKSNNRLLLSIISGQMMPDYLITKGLFDLAQLKKLECELNKSETKGDRALYTQEKDSASFDDILFQLELYLERKCIEKGAYVKLFPISRFEARSFPDVKYTGSISDDTTAKSEKKKYKIQNQNTSTFPLRKMNCFHKLFSLFYSLDKREVLVGNVKDQCLKEEAVNRKPISKAKSKIENIYVSRLLPNNSRVFFCFFPFSKNSIDLTKIKNTSIRSKTCKSNICDVDQSPNMFGLSISSDTFSDAMVCRQSDTSDHLIAADNVSQCDTNMLENTNSGLGPDVAKYTHTTFGKSGFFISKLSIPTFPSLKNIKLNDIKSHNNFTKIFVTFYQFIRGKRNNFQSSYETDKLQDRTPEIESQRYTRKSNFGLNHGKLNDIQLSSKSIKTFQRTTSKHGSDSTLYNPCSFMPLEAASKADGVSQKQLGSKQATTLSTTIQSDPQVSSQTKWASHLSKKMNHSNYAKHMNQPLSWLERKAGCHCPIWLRNNKYIDYNSSTGKVLRRLQLIDFVFNQDMSAIRGMFYNPFNRKVLWWKRLFHFEVEPQYEEIVDEVNRNFHTYTPHYPGIQPIQAKLWPFSWINKYRRLNLVYDDIYYSIVEAKKNSKQDNPFDYSIGSLKEDVSNIIEGNETSRYSSASSISTENQGKKLQDERKDGSEPSLINDWEGYDEYSEGISEQTILNFQAEKPVEWEDFSYREAIRRCRANDSELSDDGSTESSDDYTTCSSHISKNAAEIQSTILEYNNSDQVYEEESETELDIGLKILRAVSQVFTTRFLESLPESAHLN